MKPAATGSEMTGNTTGTVRVACSKGPTVEVPCARMTSGASAAAACLRISAASLVAQCVSIRTLRPMVHPDSASVCKNAPMRVCDSASSAENGMSTPMRRIRSACCACDASGHAAAAPPSVAKNFRRPM
jgi:hypothetical protein